MKLFKRLFDKGSDAENLEGQKQSPAASKQLHFYSTAVMERGFDGTEDSFARFYWAIYNCSPAEPAGINDRREQLREKYPDKAVAVGQRFVLFGDAAYQALGGFYRAMETGHAQEAQRKYYGLQFERLKDIHEKSQSLPIPIDLSEGQLAHDEKLEFLACLAISKGHIL